MVAYYGAEELLSGKLVENGYSRSSCRAERHSANEEFGKVTSLVAFHRQWYYQAVEGCALCQKFKNSGIDATRVFTLADG